MNRVLARALARLPIPPLMVMVGLAVVWTLISSSGVVTLPGPVDIASELIESARDGVLATRVRESLVLFVYAYPAAVIAGFLLGVAIGSSRYWRSATHLLLLGAYSVPKLIFFPVFLMILGIGDASKIALIFYAGTLPVLVATVSAIDAIPITIKKLSLMSTTSFWRRSTGFYLPAMMPELLVGARLSLGISLMYVALSEMLIGFRGLGYELSLAYQQNAVDRMLMIAGVLFMLGMIGSWLLMVSGRRFRVDDRSAVGRIQATL